MERRKKVMNEKGFTLIEIIAVLVILAIMAAVAIPKYLNMQQTAANNAASGALAAAASNVSMAYSNTLISTGTSPGSAALATTLSAAANGYLSLGDYTATYTSNTANTTSFDIVVSAPAGVTQPAAANTKKTVIVVP